MAERVLLKIIYVLICRMPGLVVILFRSDRAIACGCQFSAPTDKTLHQLRHSRLTHLGEANVSVPC